MTNITDVTRLPICKDRKEKHMMMLKNENKDAAVIRVLCA